MLLMLFCTPLFKRINRFMLCLMGHCYFKLNFYFTEIFEINKNNYSIAFHFNVKYS